MSIILKDIFLNFRKYNTGSTHLKTYILEFFRSKRSYIDFCALENLNVTFNDGERIGIVGLNGAGKSTLLKLLAGIYTQSSGDLVINGSVIPLIEIGSGFHPELTGKENVILNCALFGLDKKNTFSKIDEIFEFAELKNVENQQIKYYSTGMNLRLGFSICSVIEPDILIMDEFFAGGDHHFIEKSKLRLSNLISNARILILVSHDLNYIKEYCNRVIWLENGKIIADGPVDHVLPLYESH